MTLNTTTIFSEDHREEKVGLGTLIGMIPGLMNLQGVAPIILPKFVIHTRIHLPVDGIPRLLKLKILDIDENTVAENEFLSAQLENANIDAKNKGLSIVGIAINLVMVQLVIAKDGEFRVYVETESERILSGHIVYKIVEPSIDTTTGST